MINSGHQSMKSGSCHTLLPPSLSIPQHQVCEQWQPSEASPALPSSTLRWGIQDQQGWEREIGKKISVQEQSLEIQELIPCFPWVA